MDLSVHSSEIPSVRRHNEMGSLLTHLLLQFFTNLFETLQVFYHGLKMCTWFGGYPPFISAPEHKVLMVSYCGQSMSVVRHAASTIALKAYSSYTPEPIDSILGRKHRGDL